MSIERFYTTEIAVKRMEWSNDSGAEVVQDSFTGHVQQARPEYVEQVGEVQGKVFLVWCAIDTDVEEGDTLTIATGPYAGSYSVKATTTNAVGSNQHLELLVIKDVE